MDEFTRMRTFVRVVEAGSFSAAAREKHATSTVARQIQSLEDDLGVRLVNRSSRRLSLTEPGQIFYERACEILRSVENAKAETTSFQDSAKGLLRVALRVTVGQTVVMPALPDFIKKYPDLSVEILLTDDRLDLISNNIDLAVWIGDMPDSELIARRLRPSERIVVGTPKYFQEHGIPAIPADLQDHNCLQFTARSYGHNWEFLIDGEYRPVPISGNLKADNGAVLLSAALADVGIIIAHEWMVRRALDEGRLVQVLEDHTVRPRAADGQLYLVYPSSRGLSRKVRVFADFLVELFK